MREFTDEDIAGAFLQNSDELPPSWSSPDTTIDYGWERSGYHLVLFRRTSRVNTGDCTVDFLGYMLEPYDDGWKYKFPRQDSDEHDFHNPDHGAPLTRAWPTALGAIRPSGHMTFELDTHACDYGEMEIALDIVRAARDWAEEILEIER